MMPTHQAPPLASDSISAPRPTTPTRRIVGFRPATKRYNRATDLARLLPLWPEQLADTSVAGRQRVVQALQRAIRSERQRGVGGHWAYDLARHANLMWALKAERAALAELARSSMRTPGIFTASET